MHPREVTKNGRATMMNVPAARLSPSRSLTQRRSQGDALDTTEYQAYGDEVASTAYRGFSTSIAGSFQSLNEERIDACSLVCCGVMQSDRDRYLLTGIRPPTCWRRTMTHIVFPVSIFLVACYAAVKVPNVKQNQAICSSLILFLVCILILQCCKGRWKRTKVRKELLWRKYHMGRGDSSAALLLHIEEDRDDVSIDNDAYAQGQSKWDIFCAHALLGCYSSDIQYRNPESSKIPSYVPSNNLCGCLWNAFTMSCCGRLCGWNLQLCGMCALAQEGREVERLMVVPRLDYLTYQPVLEYAPALWRNRTAIDTPWYRHFTTLSKLSKNLLIRGIIAVLVLTLLWPRDRWEHLVVVLLTFAHAAIFLFIVHWPYHRNDVSVDALIKYFCSGFILATTLAVSWELVLVLILRTFMMILFTLLGIDVAYDADGYQGHLGFAAGKSFNYRDYVRQFGNEHPGLHIFYLLVSSYCVAALVEEICKYLGYRMVDHVDVWSNAEVEKAIDIGIPEGLTEAGEADQDDVASCCHPGTLIPSPQVINDRIEDHQSAQTDQNESKESSSYHLGRLFGGDEESKQPTVDSGRKSQSEPPKRTLQSLGGAVTVSMVACALGFSCCENLVYMFLYHSEYGLLGKLYVLLIRAIMPIHAIAAAIQSVGVCRRDLEQESSHQLGRIILPAILLHGTFDFVLWFLDFLAGDHYSATWAMLSWGAGIFIILIGLSYFLRQTLEQRKRLARLDNESAIDESNLL